MIQRNKFNSNGEIDQRKARLVVQRFSQKPEIDFNETFASVVCLISIVYLQLSQQVFKLQLDN